MTNYNEKLDKILNWQQRMFLVEALIQDISDTHKLEITDDIMNKYRGKAKQAITSLIKELVEEAKPPYYSVEEPGHNARHDGIEQYETNLKELLR